MADDKKFKRKKQNSPLKYVAAAGVAVAVVAVAAVVGGVLSKGKDEGSRIKVESVAASLETTEAPETQEAEPISIVLETTLSDEEIKEQEHDAVVQSVLDGRVIGESAYQYNLNRQRAYGGAY